MLIRKNYYSKRRKKIKNLVLDVLSFLENMLDEMREYLINSTELRKNKILEIEEMINSYEEKIEEYIIEMTSLGQLDILEIKWIFSMSRIIRELERAGDQVINVLSTCDNLDTTLFQKVLDLFLKYELKMIYLLKKGIEEDDIEKLNETISFDQYINELEKNAIEETIDAINLKKNITEEQLKTAMISRFLERIGDHLANTAKVYKNSIKSID